MSVHPGWIDQLANAVASCMDSPDETAPLACHHYYDEASRTWEVAVFVLGSETLGGPDDGLETWAANFVDLEAIRMLFSSVNAVTWQTLPAAFDDDYGSHIAITGVFAERRVKLAILAMAPEQFEAGCQRMAEQVRVNE